MKLLRELTQDIEILHEAKEGEPKNLFIAGTFMQYNMTNKNGRIYPKAIMEKEVKRYNEECIALKRGFGELTHPNTASINLERVSHLIESLKMEQNGTVYGKARVLNTPMGNIVRGLIEGGASIGVSSRGLGSLKAGKNGENEVQEDFRLVTPADCVADPSAPSAFVQGIMEDCEWLYDEKFGSYLPQKSADMKKELRKYSVEQIQEAKLKLLEQFIRSL